MMHEFVTLAGVRFEVIEVDQPRDGRRKVDTFADTDEARVFVKRGLSPDDFERTIPGLRDDVLCLLGHLSPVPSAA